MNILNVNSENFLDDYGYLKPMKIDMGISGKYLIPTQLNLDVQELISNMREYPSLNLFCKIEKQIAKRYKISQDKILLGAGANGLLQGFIKTLIKSGDELVTPYFSFHQAIYAVNSLNGVVKCVNLNDDFSIDTKKILKAVNKKTKIVYICNPNNPTGCFCDSQDLISIAKKINCVLIVDEASIEFTGQKSLLEYQLPNNIIVLRSFSKSYGLSGLRVGFAYCN